MTIRGAGNSIGTAMRSWRRAPWMIFILYPAAWPALYSLSSAYWFLPAGMRVAALWATPLRFWPGLALAEWAGILITSPVFPVFDDLVPAIGGTLVPWLIYAVVVREVRQYAARSDGDASTHALSYAVVAGLVGAAANGLFLVGLRWLDDETVTHPVQLFLTFAFGDYAGIMTLVPLVVMALDKRDPVAKRTRRMRYALALLPSLGVGLTLVPGLQGIRDRANALGATYHFSASSGHPRHWMRLVLAPVNPHAGRVDGFDAGSDASGTGRGFPFPPIAAPRRPAGWPLD